MMVFMGADPLVKKGFQCDAKQPELRIAAHSGVTSRTESRPQFS
jgi:hypothetical protein